MRLDLGEAGLGSGAASSRRGTRPRSRPRAAASPTGPRATRSACSSGAVPVRRPRHPEHVADDHRAPRHRRLPDGRHGAHALLDGAGPLGLEPDEKARAVDQVDHGQVEGLGQVHEPLDLLAGVGGPGAGVVERIARHQRDRPPSRRARPVIDRAAVRLDISKNDPRSTTASMIGRIW